MSFSLQTALPGKRPDNVILTFTMQPTNNSRAARRRMNKKKKATDVVLSEKVPLLVKPQETETDILHRRIAEKIVNVCINNNMTIFGSYVREYMCNRNFDPATSDIDIFSKTHNVEEVREILNSSGFQSTRARCRNEKYNLGSDSDFTVHHFTVRMANDVFFTGSRLSIDIDFVECKNYVQPCFNSLDFSCNAWIWDEAGIRLSRCTGTKMDDMSAREIKEEEMRILEDAKNFRTVYYPLDKEGDILDMDETMIFRRLTRVSRIHKMLERGWSIENLPQLIYGTSNNSSEYDKCLICQDEIKMTRTYSKLSCCGTKYHRGCFLDYARDQLKERTYVRCVQRCSELHL